MEPEREDGAHLCGPYSRRAACRTCRARGGGGSSGTYPSDIGSNSRIFARLPQGYQLGMNGMSGPLYEFTLTTQDVSGEPVNQVVGLDEPLATV